MKTIARIATDALVAAATIIGIGFLAAEQEPRPTIFVGLLIGIGAIFISMVVTILWDILMSWIYSFDGPSISLPDD
jgi:hypothetical protein